MLFIGAGALLQSAVSSALDRGYVVDKVFGNTDATRAFCSKHNIPFELSHGLNDRPDRLRSSCRDGICFSVDNALILKRQLFTLTGLSFFGIHSGILPFQRGNPIVAMIFAILYDSPQYGVTLHKLDQELDAGEIISVRQFALNAQTQLHEVISECARLCHLIFEENLDAIMRGEYRAEVVSAAGTRPYLAKDLLRLGEHRRHANFGRATNYGIFDSVFSAGDLALIDELRSKSGVAPDRDLAIPRGHKRELSYWKGKLEDYTVCRLTRCAQVGETEAPAAPAQFPFTLPIPSGSLLQAIADGLDVPKHIVLLAAFCVLLGRYTASRDLCVGATCAEASPSGRTASPLPVRADVSGTRSFSQLARELQRTYAEAEENRVPTNEIVSALRLDGLRDLIPIIFLSAGDGDIKSCRGGAGYEQEWAFSFGRGRIAGVVHYQPGLFNEEFVRRLVYHYEHLLMQILDQPDAPLRALEVITPSEREVVLKDWNGSSAALGPARCLHEAIEEQVDRTKDASAVIGPRGEYLSYGALNAASNRLARALQQRGVGKEMLVGVCLPRGVDMVIGLLGILKSGAAFVPIDPDYPAERVATMLTDANAAAVVTSRAVASRLPVGHSHLVIVDDGPVTGELERQSAANLNVEVEPHELAYVIYTSGSTGQPKGVLVEHRSVYSTFAATQLSQPLAATDRLLGIASFGSDASVWQLLAPLCWGATVVINAEPANPLDILRSVERYRVTALDVVPSSFPVLLEEVDRATHDVTSLRYVILGGEAFTNALLQHASRSLPHCTIFNAYGPTEASCQVTFHRCRIDDEVSIGRPLAASRLYILGLDGELLPAGGVGEIWIGGPCVARGYLNNPTLTAERFHPDPFSEYPGARMYKTGDLGRHLENGEIEFLGRADHQIKIRGYRIELGEVESALRHLPHVEDALVSLSDGQTARARLVGYVVTRKEDGLQVQLRHWHEQLRSYLPSHMVPAAIVPLQRWPLTDHGKIDRRALPIPEGSQAPTSVASFPPRSDVERSLAEIWRAILGIEHVGMRDHFRDLDGHSLKAVRLIAEIRRTFGVELSLRKVFEMSTIEAMAASIEQDQPRKVDDRVPHRPHDLDTTLPAEVQGRGTPADPFRGDILLTGSTGFLGRHILCTLLKRSKQRIRCLVRASTEAHARARLAAALQLTETNIAWDERIEIVVGDLALPRLGLSADAWSILASRVSSIVHAGAHVNHVADYATLKGANVGGTLELLRLASTGPTKFVHFVSSIDAVCVPAGCSPSGEALLCDEPPSDGDAYTLTKWVADQLVAKADARDIPVSIYRPGYIGPHSTTGDFNSAGWVDLYLRTALKLGCVPADLKLVPLTPVDIVADAIVEQVLLSGSAHRAFHLVGRECQPTLQHVLEAAAQAGGNRLDVVSTSAWRERLGSYCAAHPTDPAVVLSPYLDDFAGRELEQRATATAGEAHLAPAFSNGQAFDVGEMLRSFFRRLLAEPSSGSAGKAA
jgi:amino acid adenylation domain-containing protein/thioester reductase-like protein